MFNPIFDKFWKLSKNFELRSLCRYFVTLKEVPLFSLRLKGRRRVKVTHV